MLLKIGKGQKWYQIFGTKVYNHQNGIVMQIKAWKLDHEFIIGSSLKSCKVLYDWLILINSESTGLVLARIQFILSPRY